MNYMPDLKPIKKFWQYMASEKLTDLGGIGGTAFTPIVCTPQVAILGGSRAQYKQRYREEDFEKRLMLPLSLSYDHRVIDGAEGARFLRWICEVLEDPYTLLK